MKKRNLLIFLLPTMLIFVFYFIYPLLVLLLNSFRGEDGQLSLANYVKIVTNDYYLNAIFNSLWLSISVTLVSLLVASVLAFFLARTEFKGKSIYITLLTFPISFPGVVVGFMIIILFGTTGLLPIISENLTGEKKFVYAYTLFGIFLSYLYFAIPRALMTIYGAIKDFDYTIEEAGYTVGANKFQVMRYVILPTLFPAFLSAGTITFATAMSAFGTAFTLTNQFNILPILMYSEYTLNFNIELASSIAVLIGFICVSMNIATQYLLKRGGLG